MRKLLNTPNTFEPTWPGYLQLMMRAAQFTCIFVDNCLGSSETIMEALEVYRSFHVLEALPARWSHIHLFKCNCSTCFTHASCTHILLASNNRVWCAIEDHYISSLPKAWTPSELGQQVKEGDAEEEALKKVHSKGYEVPSATMRRETDRLWIQSRTWRSSHHLR